MEHVGRAGSFALGAFLLIVQGVWRDRADPFVVGAALILMGYPIGSFLDRMGGR